MVEQPDILEIERGSIEANQLLIDRLWVASDGAKDECFAHLEAGQFFREDSWIRAGDWITFVRSRFQELYDSVFVLLITVFGGIAPLAWISWIVGYGTWV